MFSDVIRCFWRSQDALKMCSDDHKCWTLDFLQIFSWCSLDVLWMFSGFSQDVLRIFPGCSEGSCERGGSGGSGPYAFSSLKVISN